MTATDKTDCNNVGLMRCISAVIAPEEAIRETGELPLGDPKQLGDPNSLYEQGGNRFVQLGRWRLPVAAVSEEQQTLRQAWFLKTSANCRTEYTAGPQRALLLCAPALPTGWWNMKAVGVVAVLSVDSDSAFAQNRKDWEVWFDRGGSEGAMQVFAVSDTEWVVVGTGYVKLYFLYRQQLRDEIFLDPSRMEDSEPAPVLTRVSETALATSRSLMTGRGCREISQTGLVSRLEPKTDFYFQGIN